MSDTIKHLQDICDMAENLLTAHYFYLCQNEAVLETIQEIAHAASIALDDELPYCDPPLGCGTFGIRNLGHTSLSEHSVHLERYLNGTCTYGCDDDFELRIQDDYIDVVYRGDEVGDEPMNNMSDLKRDCIESIQDYLDSANLEVFDEDVEHNAFSFSIRFKPTSRSGSDR